MLPPPLVDGLDEETENTVPNSSVAEELYDRLANRSASSTWTVVRNDMADNQIGGPRHQIPNSLVGFNRP